MRGRVLLRPMMILVGLALLAFYLIVAYAGIQLVIALWAIRPDLELLALVTVAVTLLVGYLSYTYGTARLLRRLQAHELPRHQAPEVYQRLDRLCERMELTHPRIMIARMPTPNAFSLGGARTGVVVFDRSLIRLLDVEELEAILAHELAHLERHDALLQTLAFTAGRTVVGILLVGLAPLLILLQGFAQAVAWLQGRPWSWSTTMFGRAQQWLERSVMLVFSGLTLLVLAHSRRREFAADDRAATVTNNPRALARALRKIQRAAEPGWGLLSLLYIQTDERDRLGELLSTHPSTEDRIERLLEQAKDRHDTGAQRIRIQ